MKAWSVGHLAVSHSTRRQDQRRVSDPDHVPDINADLPNHDTDRTSLSLIKSAYRKKVSLDSR